MSACPVSRSNETTRTPTDVTAMPMPTGAVRVSYRCTAPRTAARNGFKVSETRDQRQDPPFIDGRLIDVGMQKA